MSRCHDEQRVTPTQVVDHVAPHRGDEMLFWDRERNWQALCRACHDAKTRAGL
jgi:5-methylcytosine-specific restriction protein A